MSLAKFEELTKTFFVISGPCVIESLSHTLKMAEWIKKIADSLKIPFIFKASFDKANRSSIDSFRGPGLHEGLEILRQVKNAFHLPILTDVHLPDQVSPVAEVADIIQIPAFLCRQTDLIVQAARSNRMVNIKKGQFVAPHDMQNVVEKCHSTGNHRLFLTERGSSFGYNNLVVDMRSFSIMNAFAPTIFDASHSVQLPGGGKVTGGDRRFIVPLAKAAVAAGAKALFIESHNEPDKALSDATNIFPVQELEALIKLLYPIYQQVQCSKKP